MKIVNIEPTIKELKEQYNSLNISQQYVVDSIIYKLKSLPTVQINNILRRDTQEAEEDGLLNH